MLLALQLPLHSLTDGCFSVDEVMLLEIFGFTVPVAA